jgi:hypothetical protein
MVNLFVGVTDFDWFHFLTSQPSLDEVNFWQPGGRTNFRALQPGMGDSKSVGGLGMTLKTVGTITP